MFRLWHFFLDLLFPPSCIRCSVEGVWLCSACRSALPLVFREGEARSLLSFSQPWVAESLHLLKYQGVAELGVIFGEVLAEGWRQSPLRAVGNGEFVVTAIPLHPQRQRDRGFNQSEIIARAFANSLGLPYLPLLQRTKHTAPQATLGREDRLKNLKGVFAILRENPQDLDTKRKLVFSSKTVILIDDVLTTGTTLHAARTVLESAGVKRVLTMTLAYAPLNFK